MFRRAHRHAFVLAIYFAWLVPAAASLAITLHVALDHEGDGANPELLLGIVHGHVHLDGESNHRHDVTGPPSRQAPEPRSATPSVLAAVLRSGDGPARFGGTDHPAPSSRGSPLHQRLCVFLL